MSGFDTIDCTSCQECMEPVVSRIAPHQNSIVACVSGFFFFLGWWIMIFTGFNYSSEADMKHVVYICGVVATLAFVMINAVSNSQVRGDDFTTGGCLGSTGARIWLFIGFLLAFSGLIGSCWVLFGEYVAPKKTPTWPGVAVFLQNLFIFISALLFKFGRKEELWQ